MRYDPDVRLAKYQTLQSLLNGHHIATEILLGEAEPDAMRVWLPGSSSEVGGIRSLFWVHRRNRGWFVGVTGPRRYRILDESAVAISFALADAFHQSHLAEAIDQAVTAQRLTPINEDTWHREEAEELCRVWQSSGWFALSQGEEITTWRRVNDTVILPHREAHFTGPMLAWDISQRLHATAMGSPQIEGPVTLAIFDAMRSCTQPDQFMFALDWDHPCFRFFPHQGVRKAYRDYWAIPLWPRGDSYYFISARFDQGVVASRLGELRVVGAQFTDAVNVPLTRLLGPAILAIT
jgi:hypothetical protein